MWPFMVFALWPLIEISLFVTLGGWMGLWLSLAVVLGSAVLGVALIRAQGKHMNATLRQTLQQGRDPSRPMARGAMRVLAGVLLFLPGFLTDMLGLILLVPPVQLLVLALMAQRFGRRTQRPAGPDVVDGEWTRLPADPPEAPGKSGWTQH